MATTARRLGLARGAGAPAGPPAAPAAPAAPPAAPSLAPGAAPSVPPVVPARGASRGRWPWWPLLAGVVALVAVVALWLRSLGDVDLARIDDFGLLPALPWTFYAALGLLALSFQVNLGRRNTPGALLGLHVVVLVVVVHATPALLYAAPRYTWVYKHIGVTEYLMLHGAVDRSVDVYHNWPGFFGLAAVFTQAAGITSPMAYAEWAPVFFNLAVLVALVFVLGSFTSDGRVVWLGAFLFFSSNWIGQDYFAPQALAFVLALVVLGACVRWLQPVAGVAVPSRRRRAVVVGLVLLIHAAVVVTHQLTPFMVLAGMTALVVFRRCRVRTLPVVAAVMAMAWTLLAYPYVSGQFDVFGSLGDLAANAAPSDLSGARPGTVVAARTAQGVLAGMGLLAGSGVLRRARRGRRDVVPALLAAAPFSAVVAQHYGGEVVMRAALFSLPWLSFLAARAFYPSSSAGGDRWTTLAATVAGLALLGGFLFAYYGLERLHHVRPGEVAAVRRFYRGAPAGSLLMFLGPNVPSRLGANYDDYVPADGEWALLDLPEYRDGRLGGVTADEVADTLAGYEPERVYLLLSRSQVAHADQYGLAEGRTAERLGRALAGSERFRIAYRNRDATLLELRR